ncbi:hypothetical protein [Peptacetobacter sp. AB800]|uniref:hypothetical protein n=1 Tax=Peptacetobacter sp. AB800 TaxID=3388428 RepID=UPI0039FDE023
MAWSIKNIENQVSNVEGAYTLTYAIEGMPTIKKHELSTNNGVFYKEITPVGNLTGFSVNVEATSELKNCYIRCTDSEGHSQTSNLFTVQFVSPSSNNPPTISNIKIQNVNQSGVYQIVYEATDDSSKDLTHYLKIDNEGYKQITPIKSENTYTYNGTSLSNGTHVCNLKVSDGSVETESSVFQIIIPKIVNTPPKISEVTVEETSYKGRFRISYTATDIDKTDLITHKLKIDTNEYEIIKPISVDNKYVYNGLGLTEGTHEGIIQISDGVNEVNSSPFSIVINAQEGVGLKQQLSEAKGHYDTSYNSLMTTVRDVIDKMTNDKQYDNSIGANLVEQAYKDYTDKSVKLKDISQQAIDLIGSKKTSDAKENLAKEIGDLTNSLGSLDQSMNDVFKDGILTEAEKITIRQHLQSLSLEKVDVDNQYNSILGKFNKTDLDYAEKGVYPPVTVEGTSSKYPDKKWYLKVYKDFQSAYESYSKKYENLILIIDYILKKDGILDDIDKNKKNKAFEEYTLAIGEYSKQASLAIEAIGRNETENNETLIQTFKGEYVRTNRENSAKLTALTQTTNGLTEQVSEFKQTADRIQTQVTQNTNGLAKQQSTITQLSNEIKLAVTEGEFGSLIRQNANSIVIGLQNQGILQTNFEVNGKYGTLWNGFLACDKLTSPPGHYPIISLFGDSANGNCAIDATNENHTGWGDSIRLQWDRSNYIRVSTNWFAVYQSGYGSGRARIFEITNDAIQFRGDNIVTYNANGKYLNAYQVTVNSIGDNGRGAILMRSDLDGHSKSLGSSSSKWSEAYATTFYGKMSSSSDINLKENIHYLNNNKDNGDKLLIENTITTNDLYNFVKKDLKLTTYNYNEKYYGDLYDAQNVDTELGFVAQDITGTSVENLVLRKDDADNLAYSLNGYVSVLAGALQVAINKIETLETEINNLKNGGNQ